MSDAQFERHHTECLQEARKVMASARTEGGAIVYGEATYLTCLKLKGVIYKGKTVDWKLTPTPEDHSAPSGTRA